MTGTRGRERGNGDGNKGGEGGEDKNRDRDGNGNGNGNGNDDGDVNGEEGGGERESGNLQNISRGWVEDARVGATPTGNRQPQPQVPTPQRDCRIMMRTRAQRREVRVGTEEGRGGVKGCNECLKK